MVHSSLPVSTLCDPQKHCVCLEWQSQIFFTLWGLTQLGVHVQYCIYEDCLRLGEKFCQKGWISTPVVETIRLMYVVRWLTYQNSETSSALNCILKLDIIVTVVCLSRAYTIGAKLWAKVFTQGVEPTLHSYVRFQTYSCMKIDVWKFLERNKKGFCVQICQTKEAIFQYGKSMLLLQKNGSKMKVMKGFTRD